MEVLETFVGMIVFGKEIMCDEEGGEELLGYDDDDRNVLTRGKCDDDDIGVDLGIGEGLFNDNERCGSERSCWDCNGDADGF